MEICLDYKTQNYNGKRPLFYYAQFFPIYNQPVYYLHKLRFTWYNFCRKRLTYATYFQSIFKPGQIDIKQIKLIVLRFAQQLYLLLTRVLVDEVHCRDIQVRVGILHVSDMSKLKFLKPVNCCIFINSPFNVILIALFFLQLSLTLRYIKYNLKVDICCLNYNYYLFTTIAETWRIQSQS